MYFFLYFVILMSLTAVLCLITTHSTQATAVVTHTTHLYSPPRHKITAKMARIYIGNLPMDVTEKDMDDVFYKFGRIVDIDLKTPARPPAFGFITFQDARDAEEAVRAR